MGEDGSMGGDKPSGGDGSRERGGSKKGGGSSGGDKASRGDRSPGGGGRSELKQQPTQQIGKGRDRDKPAESDAVCTNSDSG